MKHMQLEEVVLIDKFLSIHTYIHSLQLYIHNVLMDEWSYIGILFIMTRDN